MKRIISLIAVLAITFCLSAPFAYAEGRYTAPTGNVGENTGYATREQAVACFIDAVGIDRFKTDPKILDKFPDKGKVSYVYLDEVSAGVYSGLVSGYEDGTLRPQMPITRIEALVILNRALSRVELSHWYEDVAFTDTPFWAEKQIERLASAGIVKGYGDGTLGAYDYLTLEQINVLCRRISKFTGPAGDFYDYVNSKWLNDTQVSGSNPVSSELGRISQLTSRRVEDIIFSLYRRYYNDGEEFDKDSDEYRIITVYSASANQGYRDKIGFAPVCDILQMIDGAKNLDELAKVMAELEKMGFTTLIPIGLDINIYNSQEYIMSVANCYTGIDSSLWQGDNGVAENIFKEYLEKLFALSGDSDAKSSAEDATEICRTLGIAAAKGKKSDKLAEICKTEDFARLYPKVNMAEYLKALGIEKGGQIMLYNRSSAEQMGKLTTEGNFAMAKAYLKASVLDSTASYLNSDAFYAQQDFYNRLYGTNTDYIPADFAVDTTQRLMGWELDSMYIELFFPEYAKAVIEEMTAKIAEEYKHLIKNSTRMSPQTRSRAIRKLNMLKVNSAFPDNIEAYFDRSYPIPVIEDGGSLVAYMTEYAKSYNAFCTRLFNQGAKATRGGWSIMPHTANAMYDPTSNSITIPAGILQPPYFDASASYEENLGAIGSVIAHEISHAFDSVGARFDENGNVKDWWTPADSQGLNNLCKKIADEYSHIEMYGESLDGNLTMDENLADLAGMSCIISLAKRENLDLDKVFTSYAASWRTKVYGDYEKNSVKTDEHSPAKVRVNRVLANFDEFIEFYDVEEGDGMYIPKDRRIDIWK